MAGLVIRGEAAVAATLGKVGARATIGIRKVGTVDGRASSPLGSRLLRLLCPLVRKTLLRLRHHHKLN